MIGVVIFILSICSGALYDINHILKDDSSKIKRYKITFYENINIEGKSLILLSSNNNYFFFYDKKAKQTVIIPSSNIMTIEGKITKSKFHIHDLLINHFTVTSNN